MPCISRVWGSVAVPRHRRASSPGEKAVGGLFSDFEAVRTATVLSAQVKKSSPKLPSRNKQRKWSEDGMTAASVRPEELLTTEETLPGVLLRLQPENPSRTKLHREDKSLPVLRRVQIQRRERRSDLE